MRPENHPEQDEGRLKHFTVPVKSGQARSGPKHVKRPLGVANERCIATETSAVCDHIGLMSLHLYKRANIIQYATQPMS